MFFEMYDEADIIEATSNATMAKLNYEFDMMLMEHRQNLADIELKAVLEYCTDDDIIQMYYKEAEEIQQKSKGILRRIVDAIKALFKKIKEFIGGCALPIIFDISDNIGKQALNNILSNSSSQVFFTCVDRTDESERQLKVLKEIKGE